MADRVLNVRDLDSGEFIPLLVTENEDGTFSLNVSGGSGGGTTVNFGTPITGQSLPSGSGPIGWSSYIYAAVSALASSIGTTFTTVLANLSELIGLAVDMKAVMLHTMSPSDTLVAGQLAVTSTAAPLSSTELLCTELLLQNPADSGAAVYVGDATTQPVVIAAGREMTISVNDLQLLFIKTAAGSVTVNYLARNKS